MILIGLTGGIACGKTTVSAILSEQCHLEVIDCDKIVHVLQAPGSSAVMAIAAEWPEAVDPETKELNRSKLSEIVFKNVGARRKLARIMNPRIFLAVVKRILSAWWRAPWTRRYVVILDAPLLFETSILSRIVSGAVVVTCEPSTQLRRLLQRPHGPRKEPLSELEGKRRIASQMSMDEKRRRAGFDIQNECSIGELQQRVNGAVRWMYEQPTCLFPHMILGSVAAVAVGVVFVGAKIFQKL
eukprot:CAMPEP_0176458812 /NCGR_PEP_ID=MMETSP0127-20121128/32846_1 /TAXON_ID=938130 /ORGANISM="Platyophrya macrostoma, Strain WH" /LENGTH=241 /DNA_ID=CAMNT_0017849513 /DNA_START=63 /DNA_END=788 /DNA_ORIENTATION=+